MDLSGPAAHATVVCTLGMHRSGTSVVSRMLNLLGVHLGPDCHMLGANQDNPKGHWEHLPLIELNDEILAAFGGRWDEPPSFPTCWPQDPRLANLRDKARHLLAESFAAAPLWGWKDPRTCFTLPFWQEVIGPMRYVLCVRDPSAVTASLTRRNGMSGAKAERLWLAHLQAALAHTTGQPRLLVSYEDIINDWQPELRRMAAFVGAAARADEPRVHTAVEEFVENELCHHRKSIEDLAVDRHISFPAKGLYLSMRSHAGPRRTPADDALGVDRALDLLGATALEAWDQTAAIAGERALREQHARHSIAVLESAVQALTLDRDAHAERSAAALRALGEIRTSRAWRAVTMVRGMLVYCLPPGTRRRRLFNTILRPIAKRLPAHRAQRTSVGPVV